MPLFIAVLLKKMSYNKGTEKRKTRNKKSQNRDKKVIMADSAPDPSFFSKKFR